MRRRQSYFDKRPLLREEFFSRRRDFYREEKVSLEEDFRCVRYTMLSEDFEYICINLSESGLISINPQLEPRTKNKDFPELLRAFLVLGSGLDYIIWINPNTN